MMVTDITAESKPVAATSARVVRIAGPYLPGSTCFGMTIYIREYARNNCGMRNSTVSGKVIYILVQKPACPNAGEGVKEYRKRLKRSHSVQKFRCRVSLHLVSFENMKGNGFTRAFPLKIRISGFAAKYVRRRQTYCVF